MIPFVFSSALLQRFFQRSMLLVFISATVFQRFFFQHIFFNELFRRAVLPFVFSVALFQRSIMHTVFPRFFNGSFSTSLFQRAFFNEPCRLFSFPPQYFNVFFNNPCFLLISPPLRLKGFSTSHAVYCVPCNFFLFHSFVLTGLFNVLCFLPLFFLFAADISLKKWFLLSPCAPSDFLK